MHFALAALAVAGLANSTTTAQSSTGSSISKVFSQRAHVSLAATASGCENNPGPNITLTGSMTLSGVNARIILSNNRRFTHDTSTDVTADVVLIPAGEELQINKQPSRGGVGGNPWIYLQFTDGKRALSSPIRLGRCVQGLKTADLDFSIPTGAQANVSAGGCENSGGPDITLSGELRLGGLSAQLILTNNAKFTHATSADVVIDIVLIPAGQSIVFAKQPPLDGAGGNPYIFVQFLGGSGDALSDPIFVGRCQQL